MYAIGINGFGRIGRQFFRVAQEKYINIAAINEPLADPKYLAYLLKFDSTHGSFYGKICSDDKHLIVNKVSIPVFNEVDPRKVPWKKSGVEYVLESSGRCTTAEQAKGLLEGGVKKVVIAGQSKDVPVYTIGVNLNTYDPKTQIVSMSSCSVNAIAPLLKVIHNQFCITEASITTVHAAVSDFRTVDGFSKEAWRIGRGGIQNIIPTPCIISEAIGRVIPELLGRIDGVTIFVPVANVSLVDLTARLFKMTFTYDDVKLAIREAAESSMRGIICYTDENVVSSDIRGNGCSCVFDSKAGLAVKGLVKIIGWYDNEVGYATKLLELIQFMKKRDDESEQTKEAEREKNKQKVEERGQKKKY